jgi:hypothetical protein
MTHTETKAIFAKYADENGFISLNPNEIAKLESDDSLERIDLENSLNEVMNFYDTEFNDNNEKEWRFLE